MIKCDSFFDWLCLCLICILAFVGVISVLPLASASSCYSNSYDFSYSQICGDFVNNGLEEGYIDFSCGYNDNILYISNNPIYCDKTGCGGFEVSSPYKFYLLDGTNNYYATCLDVDIIRDEYAWSYQGMGYEGVIYSNPFPEVEEVPVVEDEVDLLNDISFFEWLWNFIKKLFGGTGSLNRPINSYSGGGSK